MSIACGEDFFFLLDNPYVNSLRRRWWKEYSCHVPVGNGRKRLFGQIKNRLLFMKYIYFIHASSVHPTRICAQICKRKWHVLHTSCNLINLIYLDIWCVRHICPCKRWIQLFGSNSKTFPRQMSKGWNLIPEAWFDTARRVMTPRDILKRKCFTLLSFHFLGVNFNWYLSKKDCIIVFADICTALCEQWITSGTSPINPINMWS